jgi:hypothetical protein
MVPFQPVIKKKAPVIQARSHLPVVPDQRLKV